MSGGVPATAVCLVATCHDPLGRFAAGIAHTADALTALFGAVAVNATAETHPSTVAALRALRMPLLLGEHGAGTVGIGTARRDALALGAESGCERLLYSDLDHVVRWAIDSPDEIAACLAAEPHDLTVIGRSPAAMAASPERLRETEAIVNRVYAIANGLAESWDLMIAMRLMTLDAARTIVEHDHQPGIANDVSWPMTVAARGGDVGYLAPDGIRYLAGEDFGSDADRRDNDPREWLTRLVFATEHVRAIVDSDPA